MGVVSSGRVESSAYRAAVLADSPAAYWTHDETSGATSVDTIGSYPATWAGTYTRNASPLILTGKAVTASNAGWATAELGTYSPTAITLESVISINATGLYAPIVDRDDNGSNRMFQFIVTTGQAIQFVWFTTTGGANFATTANSIVSVGTPCHVAATYEAGTARVYKNGIQVATGTSTNEALRGGNVRATLGAGFNTSSKFSGTLDEQALYPTALSAARILAHATAGGF